MIHNRYLPEWSHRLVNALVIASLWGGVAIAVWSTAPPDSVWFAGGRWCAYATPVVIIAGLFLRRSFVRGVAGGDGYDELS